MGSLIGRGNGPPDQEVDDRQLHFLAGDNRTGATQTVLDSVASAASLMSELIDLPGSLRDAVQQANRRQLLYDDYLLPLTRFAALVRADSGQRNLPDFDPLDGGIFAECLFVLEAPGPQALKTGFVSRNNPSQTSSNLWRLTRAASIERKLTAVWNMVPWFIGKPNGLLRSATAADVISGLHYLRQLIALLPRLRVVALVGRAAGRSRVSLQHEFPRLQFFELPHPSPQWVNRAPEKNRAAILSGLLEVRRALDKAPEGTP